MDSGATTTLLNSNTVSDLNLPTSSIDAVNLTFGQGDKRETYLQTQLGEQSALVLPGVPNLISPMQALDAGGGLHLWARGGYIENECGTAGIPIARHGDSFTCHLQDVENYHSVIIPNDPSTIVTQEWRAVPVDPPIESQSTVPSKSPWLEPRWSNNYEWIDPEQLKPFRDKEVLRKIEYERFLQSQRDQAADRSLNEYDSALKYNAICLERDLLDPPPQPDTHPALLTESFRNHSTVLKYRGDNVMLRFIEGHERMGHQNYKVMQRAILSGDPAWKNFGLTYGQVGRCGRAYKCADCILAKKRRDTVPSNVPDPSDFFGDAALSSQNAGPGDIISLDPNGPVTPRAQNGMSLWFLFKDVATSMNHVVFANEQSTDTVQAAVTHVFDWYKSHGYSPKILRTDYAKVPLSRDFQAWILDKYGTRVQSSAPYCHWQNAVERDVQTIINGTSVLLHSQKWLRGDCWDLAMMHYVDLRNRTPRAKNQTWRSPLQILTGESTDLSESHRFAFGDLLAVANPGNTSSTANSWKFDAKNELGI